MYVDDLPRVALEYGAADDWTRDFLFPSPRSPYNPLVSNSTSETKTQNDKWSQQTCLRLQGHSSGNAVSIVEKLPLMLMLPESWYNYCHLTSSPAVTLVTGTAFPLVKCLTTHYGRNCEPFPGQNALVCRILTTISTVFPGVIPGTPAEAPPVLGPRHRFPLGSPAFPLIIIIIINWFI